MDPALSWLRARFRRLAWAFTVLALTGCGVLRRDTPVPIPTQAAPRSPAGRADTLVVCLPGRGDRMAAFENNGCATALREAGVRADLVAVDANLGYYYNHTLFERLRADVLKPARQQGYRRIVVVGVSLGGLGALLSEHEQPGLVDALVLLGPYLGEDTGLFDRMDAVGGPAAWAAGRDPSAGTVEEKLWTFLGTSSAKLPPTWLLCGRRDTYGRGQRLLAGLLPAARVVIIDGAHDWRAWRALWRDACLHSDLFQAERTGGSPPTPDPAAKHR